MFSFCKVFLILTSLRQPSSAYIFRRQILNVPTKQNTLFTILAWLNFLFPLKLAKAFLLNYTTESYCLYTIYPRSKPNNKWTEKDSMKPLISEISVTPCVFTFGNSLVLLFIQACQTHLSAGTFLRLFHIYSVESKLCTLAKVHEAHASKHLTRKRCHCMEGQKWTISQVVWSFIVRSYFK